MARVEIAPAALEDLDRLVRVLALPIDSHMRVASCIRPLAKFPRLGPELAGRWSGFRFILGPWRWLIIVYAYLAEDDRVIVATIQDARSAESPTT